MREKRDREPGKIVLKFLEGSIRMLNFGVPKETESRGGFRESHRARE